MTEREHLAEHDAAAHVASQLARGIVCTVDEPDAPGHRSRSDGMPDWVFEDSHQQRYVIEVGRLVPPSVRNLEAFILKKISRPVGDLPGTFVLEAPSGGIGPEKAEAIRQAIEWHRKAGTFPESFSPVEGILVYRVGETPTSLVPWVVVPDLPYDVGVDDPQVEGLHSEFQGIVSTASKKFRGWCGRRILLLRLVQSGLDRDYHVLPSLGRAGLLHDWLGRLTDTLSAVDDGTDLEVWADTGIRVWRPGDLSAAGVLPPQRVLTGHRYLNTPGLTVRVSDPQGPEVKLWQ